MPLLKFSLLLISTTAICVSFAQHNKQNLSLPDPVTRTTTLTKEESSKLRKHPSSFYLIEPCCYASNSEKNDVPSHGEAHSHNRAEPVYSAFARMGIYLFVNEKELVDCDGFLCCRLYLVNTTDTAIKFRAQDSRLPIAAEILSDSKWVSMTQFESSWCGNSYHTVTLGANEYWSFTVPAGKTTIAAKRRYSVKLWNSATIYSNEVE